MVLFGYTNGIDLCRLISYPVTLSKPLRNGIFCPLCKGSHNLQREFDVFLSNLNTFKFLSCLMAPAKASRATVISKGESGLPSLVPDLS